MPEQEPTGVSRLVAADMLRVLAGDRPPRSVVGSVGETDISGRPRVSVNKQITNKQTSGMASITAYVTSYKL